MDYSIKTLGELLSDKNAIIRRHAVGILKEYQKEYGSITVYPFGKREEKNTA